MIKYTKAFTTSNGKTFSKLSDAQAEELGLLLTEIPNQIGAEVDLISRIIANSDKVVDILTTTESSRPAARKVNGGKKTRKPKAATEATPELIKA